MNAIGTLNEKPLHAALKSWYARPGDKFEVAIDGYVVDIVRGRRLIEIQTGNFSSIKRKVAALSRDHPLRLVYPVAREKWIVRLGGPGGETAVARRRSPKRGAPEHVFAELVSLSKLIANPNFSLEVLLIREEEVRRHREGRRWRRRGWTTCERRLMDVVGRQVFKKRADWVAWIPADLAAPWTTADLAAAIGKPRWLAQKMVYCLREAGAIRIVGKRGNAVLYSRESGTAAQKYAKTF